MDSFQACSVAQVIFSLYSPTQAKLDASKQSRHIWKWKTPDARKKSFLILFVTKTWITLHAAPRIHTYLTILFPHACSSNFSLQAQVINIQLYLSISYFPPAATTTFCGLVLGIFLTLYLFSIPLHFQIMNKMFQFHLVQPEFIPLRFSPLILNFVRNNTINANHDVRMHKIVLLLTLDLHISPSWAIRKICTWSTKGIQINSISCKEISQRS